MTSRIINLEFPDIYSFTFLASGSSEIIKEVIKAGTSEFSDPDFIETDFRYHQDKLEFGGPRLLSELRSDDKEKINRKGIAGIEKYLVTLFPTLSVSDDSGSNDNTEYFSSITKVDGDEIICLLIPERVDIIRAKDSNGVLAFEIDFEGDEVRDSKILWIVTSFKSNTPRKVNLSYEAYKGDKNPVRRMSDYVLRNDDLTENRVGYTEKDGYLYSSISGSLIGTSRILRRPIYDMMCELSRDGWNRAKRYSIGDTVRMGDTEFMSVESGNIGNHPYYSRMWVKV